MPKATATFDYIVKVSFLPISLKLSTSTLTAEQKNYLELLETLRMIPRGWQNVDRQTLLDST